MRLVIRELRIFTHLRENELSSLMLKFLSQSAPILYNLCHSEVNSLLFYHKGDPAENPISSSDSKLNQISPNWKFSHEQSPHILTLVRLFHIECDPDQIESCLFDDRNDKNSISLCIRVYAHFLVSRNR